MTPPSSIEETVPVIGLRYVGRTRPIIVDPEALADFRACAADALTTIEVAAAGLGMRARTLRALLALGRGPGIVEVRGASEVRFRKQVIVDYAKRVRRRLWIGQNLSTEMLRMLIAGRVAVARREFHDDTTPSEPLRETHPVVQLLLDRQAS